MSEYHLEWLFASTLTGVSVTEAGRWTFQFRGGGVIHVECPWRLLRHDVLALSSQDHAQEYGLPSPVDAALELARHLEGRSVAGVSVIGGTCDLVIRFGSDDQLQILPFSTGHESWESFSPSGFHIVARGGQELTGFSR